MAQADNTVRVGLRVLGQDVAVEVPQPPERVRLDEVLPLIRAIDDRVVDLAVAEVEREGKRVSCCRGCSACCRAQPVPVTPPEAYALVKVVEALAPPRQEEVRRRFADRVQRLRDAGLAEYYLDRSKSLSPTEARQVTERYFRLGLACPFLEDDACSIYPDRPFVCRQYLVTSPADLCRDPLSNPIARVPMPIMAATATLATGERFLGAPQYTVPLVLALEYAQAHHAELEQQYRSLDLHPFWIRALAKPE